LTAASGVSGVWAQAVKKTAASNTHIKPAVLSMATFASFQTSYPMPA
jgi:hypothetical protein